MRVNNNSTPYLLAGSSLLSQIVITSLNGLSVRDRAASLRVGGGGKGAKEECVKENFFVKLFFV